MSEAFGVVGLPFCPVGGGGLGGLAAIVPPHPASNQINKFCTTQSRSHRTAALSLREWPHQLAQYCADENCAVALARSGPKRSRRGTVPSEHHCAPIKCKVRGSNFELGGTSRVQGNP